MDDNSYLCSFHIPKTGGTTFAFHARKSLRDFAFVYHGPFSRIERFMNGQPQLEELPDAEKQAIRIIHGHRAGLAVAESMTGRMPEFMLMLRNPYDRFVSGYNHVNSERTQYGLEPIPHENYLEANGKNVYAKLLVTHFGGLLPSRDRSSVANLMPALQSIKYFITTEHLDRQLGEVCNRYGLDGGPIEARRVSQSKSEVGIDAKTFDAQNGVDREIYATLADAAARSGGPIGNPFGYRPEALETYLARTWSRDTAAIRTFKAYEQLIKAAKMAFRFQAIYLKLTTTPSHHVTDKELLLEQVTSAMSGWLESLSDRESSAEHFWSGLMSMKEGDLASAEQYFQESIRLNPENDGALTHLANITLRRGRKDTAAGYISRALALRPGSAFTQAVHKLIFGKA